MVEVFIYLFVEVVFLFFGGWEDKKKKIQDYIDH